MSFREKVKKVLQGTINTIWFILNFLAWLSLGYMIYIIFFF